MSDTVTVVSKLPHGLRLQLQEKFKTMEPVQGGSRPVERSRFTGKVVILKGAAAPIGAPLAHKVDNGFAFTHGVDADFWKSWLEQNKDHPAVERGMVYASDSENVAADHTKEYRNEMSGFEPVNPNKMPAEFSSIKTADEQPKQPVAA
ncbi:MAG: hypothetical protein PW791_09145 [Neorhizobium sp.]|nr:hypothetical protein [Neorhizobium sp.]